MTIRSISVRLTVRRHPHFDLDAAIAGLCRPTRAVMPPQALAMDGGSEIGEAENKKRSHLSSRRSGFD
jgi:hypothetical protein